MKGRPGTPVARFAGAAGLILASLALSLLSACAPWSHQGSSALTAEDSKMPYAQVNAPELKGGLGWLNTERPLTLKELRGKVVLLDFWTFCCINCMHVIPDLKRLEAKYPDELVVIGVHSAKFDNEKDTATIREAVLRYGIEHPVVNDANFEIWQAFAVRAWPTIVLIDPEGHVVGTVSGEGNYEVLDAAIGKLVEHFKAEGKLDLKPLHLALERSKAADTPLSFPGKVASDTSSGKLFVSDSGHNRVVITDRQGRLIDVIGSGSAGAADGGFAEASFHHPQGLTEKDGILYIADTENHLIRRADLKTKKVTTIAGTGHQSQVRGGGGKALDTSISSPWDLTFAGKKLYIAMAGPHQLWVLDLDSKEIHPFAGSGREDIIDGPLKSAALAQPSGITTDGVHLYFADSEVSAVRAADTSPDGQVRTIVGEGLFDFGDKDGPGKQARLQHPLGVLFHAGRLYVADSYNHKIKTIDPVKGEVKTFIGTGKPGLTDGRAGQLSEPAGLAAVGDTLYIADTNNNAVRVVDLATRELTTLNIVGLRPPLKTTTPSVVKAAGVKTALAPNTQQVRLAALAVPPESPGKVVIEVKFPAGYHLNPEATLSYNLVGLEGDAVRIEKGHFAGKVEPPALPIEIPFRSGARSSSGAIKLGVNVYYCSEGDSSVCRVKSLLIEAPVKVEESATGKDLRLECRVVDGD